MAGIAAMDHFTRIKTIRQNGTSMSRMVTRLEPFVMESPSSRLVSRAAFDYRLLGRGAASSLTSRGS